MHNNLKGSLYMVSAMAGFALEDMFIKAASSAVPVGEILMFFGFGGTIAFAVLTLKRGEVLVHPALLSRPLLFRMASEVTGRLAFVIALALVPLSTVSAILQATPLVVVSGAALFFGEKVGWRRWSAILVGFVGVLFILRPGLEGFDPATLFAVLGMLGFAFRDLATRAAPKVLSNMQLGVYGFFILVPTGFLMLLYSGGAVWPTLLPGLQIIGATAIGVFSYYSLTIAMRTGEVSVVTPFRYTRLIFGLLLGIVIFAERPDLMTLLGSLIIVGTGVYTLMRSRVKAPKACE